ncbi:MAG: hypothetical protein ABW148_03255 [Sedimenticola sp.]
MRLILHIGSSKTGTISIQNIFCTHHYSQFPSIETRDLVHFATMQYKKLSRKLQNLDNIELRNNIKIYTQESLTEFLWLKEKYNTSFNDLDYSKIKSIDNPFKNIFLLEDICTIKESVDDKQIEEIRFPVNEFIRAWIVCKFIIRTQLEGYYRTRFAHTKIAKIKRYVLNQ